MCGVGSGVNCSTPNILLFPCFSPGRDCDQCSDGTYGLSVDLIEGCQPCRCDVSGSVNASCHQDNGQCHCKQNVVGQLCDRCLPGYYALNQSDFGANGCIHACECDEQGTDPTSHPVCGQYGGQCTCKRFTAGRRCEKCDPYSFHHGRSLDNGCVPCECDVRGVVNGNRTCDPDDGQCWCKSKATGLRCNECHEGYYGLQEREPMGCLPCECHERGTVAGTMCNSTTGQCTCVPEQQTLAPRPEIARTCVSMPNRV